MTTYAWEVPPASDVLPLHSLQRSGGYMSAMGALNNGGPIINRIYFAPLYVPRQTSFDRASLRVSTASGAGGIVRLGIYASDGAGGVGALVAELGTVPADVVATPILATALTLPPGLYWLATCAQVAVGQIFGVSGFGGIAEGADMSATNTGFAQDGVAGALPAQATPNYALGSFSFVPSFGLRVV